MPRYIAKLQDARGEEHWFVWSTIVSSPVTCSMSREEMFGHLLWAEKADSWEQWIEDGRLDLLEAKLKVKEIMRRLARTEDRGCSAFGKTSIEDLIAFNRFGDEEATLSREELIAKLVACREHHHVDRKALVSRWLTLLEEEE